MKNNTLSGRYCFKNPRFKQIFRIMRISTFLLMVCVFCSYAGNAHSQNAKVSIRMNNVKLDKILNEIENQTDYLFIYNIWGIERSGFFNGREKWAKGFENQRV